MMNKVITVQSTTIDEFLRQHGDPPIGFIKMDIEGAEPSAVSGMAGLLRRSQQLSVILEFCPRFLRVAGTNPAAFLSYLHTQFTECSVLATDGSLCRAQMGSIESTMREGETGYVNLLCRKTQH